jgi:2-methylcitrate dehydratase PrpD
MLTKTLATFVIETKFDDLPIAVTERSKNHILDSLGVILAGSTQPVGRRITRFVRSLGGNSQSSVIGGGFKTTPANAALANGTMGHALDFDDDSDTIISHPSVVILAAILALGQVRASGRDVLTAFIVSEEVEARLAAIPGFMPEHYEKGGHATSTMGIIGAAAAGAKILALDVDQTRTAFGIAVSEASGLIVNFATDTKPLHAGSAAAKGVTSALLAAEGITANANIFENPHGFFSLFGENVDVDARQVTVDLGHTFDIITPGINIKKYPCCYYTHASIDALLFLMGKHQLSPADIRSIRCGLAQIAVQVLNHPHPNNGLEAKFSFQYCVALAVLNGAVRIEDFEDEKVQAETILQFMRKIETYVKPELNADAKTLGAVIRVETADGQTYSHHMEKPTGGGNSPLPWEDIVSKFKYCSAFVLNDKDIDFVENSIRKLEGVDKINQLMEVLSKEPSVPDKA